PKTMPWAGFESTNPITAILRSECPEMADKSERSNVFFRLVCGAAVVFVITVLAMIATLFGDPQAPVNRFLDEYASRIIGGEVAATVVFGLLAMTVDRVRTLRQINHTEVETISRDV